jgi:protein ImuB
MGRCRNSAYIWNIQATRQADHLVLVLREKLARFVLPAPVIAIALHAPSIQEQTTNQRLSFSRAPGNAADRTRLLDVLVAHLGSGCIRHASPLADYLPEVANTWVSAADAITSPSPLPANVERPFWLLDTPIALDTVRHRPVYANKRYACYAGRNASKAHGGTPH